MHSNAPSQRARHPGTNEIVKIVFGNETESKHVTVGYAGFKMLPYVETGFAMPSFWPHRKNMQQETAFRPLW